MKKILLVEWFSHSNIDRYNELYHNLSNNIKSKLFDDVVIFTMEECFFESTIIKINNRVTYYTFFEYINNNYNSDTIYVIANLDIYFDNSINLLEPYDMNNKFICLTRWNLKGYCGTQDGKPLLENTMQWNPADSHDVWITKDKIKQELLDNSKYNLGTAGCDGKICYEMQRFGYITENIANDIKIYHQHLSGGYEGHRTYSENTRYGYPYGKVNLK